GRRRSRRLVPKYTCKTVPVTAWHPSALLYPGGRQNAHDSASAAPPGRLADAGLLWPGVELLWPDAGLLWPGVELLWPGVALLWPDAGLLWPGVVSLRRPPAVSAAVPPTVWPSVTNLLRPPGRRLPSGRGPAPGFG